MLHRFKLLLFSLVILTSISVAASDQNSTATNRIEIIITVAGVQETVASIEKSSQQIVVLTEQLSNKEDFTSKDHELITALTEALNNNAKAINNIADALPKQFENVQGGMNNLLDSAVVGVKEVVTTSKSDLIDPTLSRIENRVLVLVLVIAAALFGLLWYGLWKVRAIVSTGSETIANITETVKSLEKVLEKVNRSADKENQR